MNFLDYDEYLMNKQMDFIFSNIFENMKWLSTNEVEWDMDIDTKTKIYSYINQLPYKYRNFVRILINKIVSIKKVDNYKEFLKRLLFKVDSLIKNSKYKKIIIQIIILIFLYNSFVTVDDIKDVSDVNISDVNISDVNISDVIINDTIKSKNTINIDEVETLKPYSDFLKKLSFKESSNNWKSIRYIKRGKRKIAKYVGKYQFGDLAFKDIKSKIRVHKFLKNPNIWPESQQDKDILKLLNNNRHYLRKRGRFKGYKYYIGKVINGINITESGILAASHLVGNKSVRKFLLSNGKIDIADGNGTKCSHYLKEFSGYKIKESI